MSKSFLKGGKFTPSDRPKDGVPWFINVIVTTKCNLRCHMCASYKGKHQHLGPVEDFFGFFDRLAHWLPKSRMVVLTGGEPLLHPDIFEIVSHISSLGFITALNTNGAALNIEAVDKLVNGGLSVINLSLDAIGAKHEEQRNAPGLYQGIMDMIHHMTNNTKLSVSVVSVISAYNAKELPLMVKTLFEKPGLSSIQFQAIIPTMAMDWNPEFYENDPMWPQNKRQQDEVLTALDELSELRDEGHPINNPASQFAHWRKYFQNPHDFCSDLVCDVGDDSLIILADGSVSFCNRFEKLGTLKDDPKELWDSKKGQKLRRQMKKCKHSCNFFVNCCFVDEG